ncbi:MAG: PD-(D/E)XK nuclease-like domain-containing protein [Candidatus Competibacteraceae bacterium]|nr:PD-(D/E)XK nuclease-like domain-containing protein [Candidatus Competibacteraceae bacterium]
MNDKSMLCEYCGSSDTKIQVSIFIECDSERFLKIRKHDLSKDVQILGALWEKASLHAAHAAYPVSCNEKSCIGSESIAPITALLGVITMNNDEYQKLPGVSSHQLIAMLESPANCWRKYIDPQRPQQETTASLTFGTLIHCLALNPHTFDDEFLVADYEQRSKAGKERYAQLKQYG